MSATRAGCRSGRTTRRSPSRSAGWSADSGATGFLPRIVGEREAPEIALLGERFSAAEGKASDALNWIGWCRGNSSRPSGWRANSPTTRRLVRSSFDNSRDDHSHREAEGLAACAATEDHFEGLTAFLGKRKAVFKGR
jgi:2-(1,2-epoxy-1,2-dihydrophenyl)acetyl-CoA isomerase